MCRRPLLTNYPLQPKPIYVGGNDRLKFVRVSLSRTGTVYGRPGRNRDGTGTVRYINVYELNISFTLLSDRVGTVGSVPIFPERLFRSRLTREVLTTMII